MRFWTIARGRPKKAAMVCLNCDIVDARFTSKHQTLIVKLPKFVTVTSEPLRSAVMPFILKTNCDAMLAISPELFDQSIAMLAIPFLFQELHDFSSPSNETISISPHRIFAIRKRDSFWITRVPNIFRSANLCNSLFQIERRGEQGRYVHNDHLIQRAQG